jgi:hypothetical protein
MVTSLCMIMIMRSGDDYDFEDNLAIIAFNNLNFIFNK